MDSLALCHQLAEFGKYGLAQGHAVCDTVVDLGMESVELVGHGSIEGNHCRGAVGRRPYSTELEAVAGERKGRCAVAVGVVDKDFGNLRQPQGISRLSGKRRKIGVAAVLEHVEHGASWLPVKMEIIAGGASLAPRR